MTDRLATLGELWAAWAEQGRALTDDDWRRPTRLGTWDVRSLYAHAASWPVGFSGLLERISDARPTHETAADVLRYFNQPGGIATTFSGRAADSARADAARYTTEQMIAQFADTGPRALARARDLGPVVVDYFGLSIVPLGEAAGIGLVEATVHLLDLRQAIGADPGLPAAALTETAAVLARIAPPIGFIEAATGRTSSSPFPVLS